MLIVVTGPPAAGKTTWVHQHVRSGDVVIDYDTLANALAGAPVDNHEHAGHIVDIAKHARKAAIGAALPHARTVDVYLIHATPSDAALLRYRRAGARVVQIDPGSEIVTARCRRHRPPGALAVAARWYQQSETDHDHGNEPTSVSTSRTW